MIQLIGRSNGLMLCLGAGDDVHGRWLDEGERCGGMGVVFSLARDGRIMIHPLGTTNGTEA